jgi:hypothetical protein
MEAVNGREQAEITIWRGSESYQSPTWIKHFVYMIPSALNPLLQLELHLKISNHLGTRSAARRLPLKRSTAFRYLQPQPSIGIAQAAVNLNTTQTTSTHSTSFSPSTQQLDTSQTPSTQHLLQLTIQAPPLPNDLPGNNDNNGPRAQTSKALFRTQYVSHHDS